MYSSKMMLFSCFFVTNSDIEMWTLSSQRTFVEPDPDNLGLLEGTLSPQRTPVNLDLIADVIMLMRQSIRTATAT